MKRQLLTPAVLLLTILAVSTAAQAHHSAAAFDSAHPVIATGTVKNFVWANPHAWLYLMIPNEQGGFDEWEIEGPSVGTLARQKWKSSTLQPGDRIHVLMARRKDGGHGGTFMQVTRDNGEVLSTGRL